MSDQCKTLPCCDGGSYYLYSLTNGPLYGNPLIKFPGGVVTIRPIPDPGGGWGGDAGMVMTVSSSCCDGSADSSEINIPKSNFSQTISVLCCNGATSARVVTPTMTASQVQALGLAMAIECTLSNNCPGAEPPGSDDPPGPGGPFTVKLECCDGSTEVATVTPGMTSIEISELASALAAACEAKTVNCTSPPDPDDPQDHPNPNVYYPGYKVGNDAQSVPVCDPDSELVANITLPPWASISGGNIIFPANQFFVIPASTLPSAIATAKAAANAQAFAFISAWVTAALAAGDLECDVQCIITTPSPLPEAVQDESYSEQLAVSGVDPAVWTILSGTLPDGITMDSAGLISGTPTTVEDASFTVQADVNGFICTKAFDLSVLAANVCDGDPVAALKDFSEVDDTVLAAVVPDINTASAVVTFGNFVWAKYRAEYANSGAFEIDVVPPGPGPEDEWLTNANPGGGFTTLFELQYKFGTATVETNLPTTAPTFTEPSAVALMAGKFSSTVEHVPENVGSPTSPSTVKAMGIKTKTAPYSILSSTDPTWNLVRKRKLAYTLPEALELVDFALSILPAMVGIDAATNDTISAIWDGTLPGFNTGGLGPPMTFFEWRAAYNGSPNQRLFNKRIGIFCTVRHFETTFPTSTGCAFVLAIAFDGGGLAWAGYKMTGSTTSPVGLYCFRTDISGYSIAGPLADVRLITDSALPAWGSGCVLMTLTNEQVTAGDAAWSDPAPGYRIAKFAFVSPTDFPVWWVRLTALDAGSAVNVFILDSDGVSIVDFEYNMDATSQRAFAIPSAGSYFIGVAAFEADGLPRTFSLETSCDPEAPEITSLDNPTLFDGDTLFVTGKYFGLVQGGSTITINGTNATVVLWGEALIQVTVPVTTFGPGSVIVTVNGLSSNAYCCSVVDSSLKALTWEITGYDETDFDLTGCPPFASANPAWAGTFVYFDQYPFDAYWVSQNWNTTYPSNFSINGALLAQANIQYESCPTADAPATFTLWIWISDDAIGSSRTLAWKGRNSTLDTPAGVYTRVAGCAPGPATVTVAQI